MDDYVKNILMEWGFQKFITKFEEEEIDKEVFGNLTDSMISALIPTLGPRRKFEINFKNLLKAEHCEKENADDSSSTITVNTDQTLDSENENEPAPKLIKILHRHHANVGLETLPVDTAKVRRTEVLKNVLRCEEGEEIIAEYNKTHRLNRSKLVTLIIKSALKEDKNKRITSEVFIKYAEEIHLCFPSELPETYYSSYFKDSKGNLHSATGKLWDKYTNLRKFYKKIGLITDNLKQAFDNNDQPSTSSDTDYVLDTIYWLKNNSEPFTAVQEKWKDCFDARISKHLEGSNNNIEHYIQQYPALQLPLGYLLFESDFESLYDKNKKNSFFTTWLSISKEIIKFSQKKNDKYIQSYMEKYKHLEHTEEIDSSLALFLLPVLLPAPPIKRKKLLWKQSKCEQQNNFILQVDKIDDLNPALERRNNICLQYELTRQPLPILVGSLENIEACYVNINNLFYKVDTPLKAVDLCFKIFHALSAKYPTESEPTWTFIQKQVFEITTSYDKNFVCVNALISDLKFNM